MPSIEENKDKKENRTGKLQNFKNPGYPCPKEKAGGYFRRNKARGSYDICTDPERSEVKRQTGRSGRHDP